MSLTNSNFIEKALNAVAKNNESQREQQAAMDDINALLARGQTEESDKKDTAPGTLETIDNNTYEINSIEDLVAFSNNVNSGNAYEGKTVVLGKSLDFTSDDSYVNKDGTTFGDYNGDGIQEGIKAELTKGRGFIPIGNLATYNSSTNQISGNCFKGTFDGNNKSIQNILIDVTGSAEYLSAGLFGVLNGNVEDLTISGNVKITNNIQSTTARSCIGGISGQIHAASVKNCSNACVVTQVKSIYTRIYSGGIVGYANVGSNIFNCSNYVALYIGGGREFTNIGGICGYIDNGKMDGCTNYANLENTYNYSTSAGYNMVYMGGVVGGIAANGELIRCGNIGNVTSNGSLSSTSVRTAGIAGRNDGGNVISSYNKGNITTNCNGTYYACNAGIIGESYQASSSDVGRIENCFNVGVITLSGATSYRYNLPIYALKTGTVVINSYYLGTTEADIETGIKRKTEAQMKSAEFAEYLGVDFMKDPEGGYPIFTPEAERKYDYQCFSIAASSGTSLTATIDARAGDLIVATILKRANITIPEGWTVINTSKSITEGGITQTIAFAYKKVNTAGTVSLTVSQASQQRMLINLIALHGGGTPSILTDVEKIAVATNSSPITVTKPCNELVIWATSTIMWGTSYYWQTTLGVNRVCGTAEPRIANFMDYRASGSTLSCSFISSTTDSTQLAGLKITPD